MSMVTFYIFRHGETDWNVERRFQGHSDISLNQNGLKQIEDLAIKMQPLEIDIILSSDLSRARTTAEAVAKNRNIEIKTNTVLRETKLGQVEGMLASEISKQFSSDMLKRWASNSEEDLDFGFPGGETKREQLQKVKNYLEDFCEQNPEVMNIAISTHGGTLRRLINSAQGSPLKPLHIFNCALFKLYYRPETKTWHYEGEL